MNLVNAMVEAIDTQKVVRIDKKEIAGAVKTLMKAVEQVNAAIELQQTVGGTRLEDLRLPEFLRSFVYPKKVAVLPSFDAEDLVMRPKVDPDWTYDEGEVTRASYVLAHTKKIEPAFTTAAEMRGQVRMFSDINFAIKGKVNRNGDEIFVPVPVLDLLDQVAGKCTNDTADRVLDLYFNRAFTVGSKA